MGQKNILILSDTNQARSVMLEGWLSYYSRGKWTITSAGLNPSEIDPFAVKVMMEAVIDIRSAKSRTIDELEENRYDIVIALTGNASHKAKELFGTAKLIETDFSDPKLVQGEEKERLKAYRLSVDVLDDFAFQLANQEQ